MSTREVYTLYRSEARFFGVDFGENTAGATKGQLRAGDTVSSATVAIVSKPAGASDPTIGSASVNGSSIYVNDRLCSAGEAVTFLVTLGASQAYGRYLLSIIATTTNGETLREPMTFIVEEL